MTRIIGESNRIINIYKIFQQHNVMMWIILYRKNKICVNKIERKERRKKALGDDVGIFCLFFLNCKFILIYLFFVFFIILFICGNNILSQGNTWCVKVWMLNHCCCIGYFIILKFLFYNSFISCILIFKFVPLTGILVFSFVKVQHLKIYLNIKL